MQTIDQVIAQELSNWMIDGKWPIGNFILCVIALVLCILLCGAIGLEREKRGRTAGLRTHLLVGIGSCIIMIISIYGFPAIFTRDVARLAAQVVAGVGFLGAGAIIHKSSGSRGLTTAATIWVSMAIGLACGSMNFILAAMGTGIILISLTLFKRLEGRINEKNPLIVIHCEPDKPMLGKVLASSKKCKCTVADVRSEVMENGDVVITFLASAAEKGFDASAFIKDLEEIQGVKNVEFLNNHKFKA